MLEDVKYYTDLLVKLKITPNQFYLCWLLYWDHKDGKGGKRRNPNGEHVIANLYRYARTVKNFTMVEKQDLMKKGLIEICNKNAKDTLDMYEVTQKFIDTVLVNRKMEDEFWDAYPSEIPHFDNPSKPNINLKVCVQDKVKAKYRALVKTKNRHEKVMEILDWAKRQQKIRMSISNFVDAKMWEQFEEAMERDGEGPQGQFGTRTAF